MLIIVSRLHDGRDDRRVIGGLAEWTKAVSS